MNLFFCIVLHFYCCNQFEQKKRIEILDYNDTKELNIIKTNF